MTFFIIIIKRKTFILGIIIKFPFLIMKETTYRRQICIVMCSCPFLNFGNC